VIAEPPSDSGAVHVAVICAAPPAPETAVGVPGTAAVVVAAEGDDHAPWPAAFFAATRSWYDVPFANPVTVTEVSVESPSENDDHVEPFVEYCTT
jgi:hypothetical protein